MKGFLILMACLVSFVFGYILSNYNTPKSSKTVTIIHQIDSIIVERDHFVMDSINTTIDKVKRIHDSSKSKIDKVFSTGSDEDKKKEFNLSYPPLDTDTLMPITKGQAKSAIMEKINHANDSGLMVAYKKSAEDCDERLKIIKGKVDTLKITIKQDADSAYKVGVSKGATTVGIISGIIIVITAIAVIIQGS